jgi:hypothetical protein
MEVMRAGAVFVLFGLTAVVAYSIGRHETPVAKRAVVPAVSQQTMPAEPVTLTSAVDSLPAPRPVQLPANKPAVQDLDKSIEKKRTGEAVLTAAAIAAIIVKTSRDQYYATGHPCACPNDLMRNGRACGGRSAYSRPGGASPFCYPTDVTAGMIETYRRTASR